MHQSNEFFQMNGSEGDPSRRLVSRELSCGKSQKARSSQASTRPSTAQTAERRVPSSEGPKEWQSQFYRTKLCPHFVSDIADEETAKQYGSNVGNAIGLCANAHHCRFAHSFDQLRPLPDLSKTKLCASYANKTICNDPNCTFAHSPKDLRTSSTNFYKVTLCNFYKNQKCWNGPNCRFAHGEEDLRPLPPVPINRPGRLGTVRSEQGLLPTPQSSWVRGPGRAESATNLLDDQFAAEALFSLLLSSSSSDVWMAPAERNCGGVSDRNVAAPFRSTEPSVDCHTAVSAAITSDEIGVQPNGETLSSLASSRPASPCTAEANKGPSHQLLSVLREAFNLSSEDTDENDPNDTPETETLRLLMKALDVQSLADDDPS